MTAEIRATSSETSSACRIEELCSRLEYHLRVKPVKSYDEGGSSLLFLALLAAMVALACFNIWRKVRKRNRNQY